MISMISIEKVKVGPTEQKFDHPENRTNSPQMGQLTAPPRRAQTCDVL